MSEEELTLASASPQRETKLPTAEVHFCCARRTAPSRSERERGEVKTDWDVLCARSTRTAHRVKLVKVNRVAGVRGESQAQNERCVAVSRGTAIYKPSE